MNGHELHRMWGSLGTIISSMANIIVESENNTPLTPLGISSWSETCERLSQDVLLLKEQTLKFIAESNTKDSIEN
jgi:hypothetical protein